MAATTKPVSLGKHVDDAVRFYREHLKLANARFSREREVSSKSYLAGKAYFRWNEKALLASGHRYEAQLAVFRVEPAADDRCVVGKRGAYIQNLLGRDNDLMLVGYVEALDGEQRPVSSSIWLGCSNEVRSVLAGTGNENLLPDRLFQGQTRSHDGEIASLGVTAIRCGASGDEMVKSGSEIVDRVAGNERDLGRQGAPRSNPVAVKPRRWINLWPDGMGVALKIPGGRGIEISDMVMRPFKL